MALKKSTEESMRRKLLGLGLGLTLTLSLAAAGSAAAQTFTLKFGHAAPATDLADDHVAALFLKSFLESRSNGRIKVQIFPASQLGDFRAMVEQVQLGTLEMAHTSVGGIGQFVPEIQVLELPYLVPSDLVAEKLARSPLMAEIKDLVLKKTGNVRMGSATNTGRFRSFFTTSKPIHTAADLKGVKMRTVDSPMQIEFVRFLGGNPTPVVWGELYTSLKTNVVEGTKNAATDIVPNKMDDVLKYVVLDEHSYLWGFNWIADKWLKSLPADLQDLVSDGMIQMADVQFQYNKQYESKSLEDFAKKGGKIYVPSSKEKATFETGRDHLKGWFKTKYGPEWLEKLEKAVAAAEAEIKKERAGWLNR
jgi:tripartite ATP-independent transporter DctP family solute receptor